MIDAKHAVLIAKQKAMEILDQTPYNLEEIEKTVYDGHEAWSITLSFPRERSVAVSKLAPSFEALRYKRFLIDAANGDMLAMKIREVAAQ